MTTPDTSTVEGQIEATAMIARLMPDLFVVNPKGLVRVAHDEWGFAFYDVNLYSQRDMHLAWRVLNWFHKAAREEQARNPAATTRLWWAYHKWQLELIHNETPMEEMPPAKAQRAWLDEILRLKNEEGMLDAAASEGGVV